MIKYYIREASMGWAPCGAKTLAGAKRAASRSQAFQGTDLWVGARTASGDIIIVARKLHRDALDMSATGKWEDVA